MIKQRVLTSIAASAVLVGALALTGCGSSSSTPTDSGASSAAGGATNNGGSNNTGAQGNAGDGSGVTDSRTGMIIIGTEEVDPEEGGVVARTSDTQTVVMATPLNKCAEKDTSLSNGVVCGPKKGVNYVFQSDFGKLGPVDDNASTPDGGSLLFDALTQLPDGTEITLPLEGADHRIKEVYIPTNYIVMGEYAKQKSIAEQYDLIHDYLGNVLNMKCLYAENQNNPYFDLNSTAPHVYKDNGTFRATYVMHFTRGIGEEALNDQFAQGDFHNLEYLAFDFELKAKKVSDDDIAFSIEPGSDINITLKKHFDDTVIRLDTTNTHENLFIHPAGTNAESQIAVDMLKYFDKVVTKLDQSPEMRDELKKMVVDNLTHPWPVKIYGTLHEINVDGSLDRSFVRNPAELNATLFGLPADRGGNAVKVNFVYPGGEYNKLED